MSNVKIIFKNISWLLISQIKANFWDLFGLLKVNDYGILGFTIISLTSLLAIITDFGIDTHIVRHIVTDYDSS